MIQIIKEGNLKEPVMRFVCFNCGCVFEADKDDYKLIATSGDLAYITNCPHCHKRVARMMITDRRYI